MYNEIMVRLVKDAIKSQHSALHHLTVETLVKSLSVMTSLHQVNVETFISPKLGKDRIGWHYIINYITLLIREG